MNRALYRASYSGHLDAVRLLVSRGGADVDFVQESESDNRTALVAAAIGGHGDVYEFLIQRGKCQLLQYLLPLPKMLPGRSLPDQTHPTSRLHISGMLYFKHNNNCHSCGRKKH